MTFPPPGRSEEEPRVVIRDKRRIDPMTGALREPDRVVEPAGQPPAGSEAATGAGTDPVDPLVAELAERTQDLQRITAEYANFRRRVERDRLTVVELAQDRVLTDLLPLLDDVERAREHGDLTGAFKVVADQLAGVLTKHGVRTFGEPGDPFDPASHEAVMHSVSPEVSGPTCVAVMRRGYRHGDRVLRPAMVAVADYDGSGATSDPPAVEAL